jgi:hypothetical protein
MTELSSAQLREPQSALRLSRTFLKSLTAADLMEPLRSLDANQPAAMGAALMRELSATVLGVRRGGVVTGWVQPSDSAEGLLGDHAHAFGDEEVLDEGAGLDVVLTKLVHQEHLFIRWLDEVAGVITRLDLQKAPMRMWLFGTITLLDMNATWAIEELYPGETWQSLVSQGRLAKAQALAAERRKRGSVCRLVDCLQVKDKADILLRERTHFSVLGLTSRREADRFAGAIESLRNHLAHAQEIEAGQLDTAARLAAFINSIVRGEGVRRIVATQRSAANFNPNPDSKTP